MHTPWQKYLGRLGIESSIEEKEIFVDEQCHPTLVDACNLAVGSNRCTRYRHCDMEYLEKMLRRSKAGIRMIATDGVFSADGDTAPLPEIVGLAQRYEAMIFVDDAHGSGVLGRTGQGTWEHYGVSDQIDFKIGSLAKAYAGGLGAFIACGHEMAAYLRFAGGHYTFGGSIPPAIAMAIKANIVTAQHDSWRRDKVLYNAEYVRRRLRNLGYKVIGAGTPIVPIIVGESKVSVEIEHELFKAGYHAPSFRFPAVPQKEARIRATVMATHTEDQLDGFIAAFDNIASGHNATKAMASAQLAA